MKLYKNKVECPHCKSVDNYTNHAVDIMRSKGLKCVYCSKVIILAEKKEDYLCPECQGKTVDRGGWTFCTECYFVDPPDEIFLGDEEVPDGARCQIRSLRMGLSLWYRIKLFFGSDLVIIEKVAYEKDPGRINSKTEVWISGKKQEITE